MKHFLLFTALFLMHFCQAQNRTLIQETIDTLSFRQPNRVFIEDIKYTLKRDTTLRGWTKYHTFKSYVHLYKGENDSAVFHSKRALSIYDSIEKGYWASDGLIHKAYYIIGLRQFFDGKPMQSLRTLNSGLEYCRNFPESPDRITWKYDILARIATIHRLLGDYQLALEARRGTLEDEYFTTARYEGGTLFSDLGRFHKYLDNRDSAFYYYRKAIKRLNDTTLPIEDNYPIESFYTNVMSVNGNLGDLHLANSHVDSAVFYYETAYKLMLAHNLTGKNTFSLSRFGTKVNRAFVYWKKDSIQDAINMLTDVEDSIAQFSEYTREERDLKLKTHNLLSNLYEESGEHQHAIQSQKQLNQYLVDYNENSISNQLQLYTTEFEAKEKDASILRLKKDAKIQQVIVDQKNAMNWILGGLLISILGLGILFFRQRRLKNKYRTTSLEQRLLRSQLDPHFIFNSLNSAISLAEKKSENTVPYLFKFSSLLRSILKNSREEFISLSEEIQAVTDYLELESNFSQKFDYQIELDQNIDSDNLLIPPMFIQPIVENAIEHGFRGIENEKIEISIIKSQQENVVSCIIEDNGIGYSKALSKKNTSLKDQSFSGKILQERLKIYGQSLKVNTCYEISDSARETGGTKVVITFPFVLDL